MSNLISRRIPKLAAGTIFLLFCGSAYATDWQHYEPVAGGFSILLPGVPAANEQFVTASTGTLLVHTVDCETGGSSYTVIYNDYGTQLDIQGTLRGVRDREIGAGRLVSEKEVTLDGYPGKEVTATTADGHMFVSHIYVVGTRLYQVMFMTMTPGQNETAAIYFSSFHLVR